METVLPPGEITRLFRSPDEADRLRGYHAFMRRTHWKNGGSPDDLKAVACMQLFLDPRMVIAKPPERIETGSLWASQNCLEAEKLQMVEAAYPYFAMIGEELPPIVVWHFFNERLLRFVVHDGHHRAYFAHTCGRRVTAVVLEPLGNCDEVESRFREAFTLRLRVVELPIV